MSKTSDMMHFQEAIEQDSIYGVSKLVNAGFDVELPQLLDVVAANAYRVLNYLCVRRRVKYTTNNHAVFREAVRLKRDGLVQDLLIYMMDDSIDMRECERIFDLSLNCNPDYYQWMKQIYHDSDDDERDDSDEVVVQRQSMRKRKKPMRFEFTK